MFYSASTGGFYDREIHGDNIPADAVEITSSQHQALIDGQAAGKIITASSKGKPVLADPPPPTDAELAAAIRNERDAKLAACDWTQGRDIPEILAAKWAPYRQSLRDITSQATFPKSVEWPAIPV